MVVATLTPAVGVCFDQVIQLTNDYERRVFNGDAGVVRAATRGGTFTVEFARSASDEPVEYARSALDRDIGLSYALTVRGCTVIVL